MDDFIRADTRLAKALEVIGKNTEKLTPGTLKRFLRIKDAWQNKKPLQYHDRLYCLSVERWLTELGGKLAQPMRNCVFKRNRKKVQSNDYRDKRCH